MSYILQRAKFTGFGAWITPEGVYFSADIPCVNTAGILIFDLNNRCEVIRIELSREYSCGDVYSVIVKDLDMTDKGYLFSHDGISFLDPYSFGIFEIGKGNRVSLVDNDCSPKDFENDRRPCIPYSECVFYNAHVKGLTKADNTIKKEKGTFHALILKADYLCNLGVTSVILMPVYEFESNNNYWGFGDAFYFAVKSSYAASENASYEFKEFVKAYHCKGLEVILMVNFGCNVSGNFTLEVLRFYREIYHVDGFRLIGPAIDINLVVSDPFLKDCKLIFENFDPQNVVLPSNIIYKNVAFMSDSFLNNARRFLKGDDDLVSYMSYAVRENASNYSVLRNITDFRTLTLWDMVSFNRKHNELNGEDNLDGNNYNFSWNCGEEGDTNKVKVNKLRNKQVRNAAVITYLCQGTPLILSGDEILNSNKGNNNPYCQDNEIGWVTRNTDEFSNAFYTFLKNLLAFRKRHSVLHQPKELMLFDYISCKCPDISFHGEEAFKMDQTPSSREFAVMYCGDYSRQYTKESEASVYIAYNMHWEDRKFMLPKTDNSCRWHLLFSSDGKTDDSFDESKMIMLKKNIYKVQGRSVAIFLQKKI